MAKEKFSVARYDYYGGPRQQVGSNLSKERAEAYCAEMRPAHPGVAFVVEPQPAEPKPKADEE